MKTLPSLRTSSLLLVALLGVSASFALQAPQAPSAASGGASGSSSSGTSGSGTLPGSAGTGGTSGSASGSASGGAGSSVQPGAPIQPGLPTQPGIPGQPVVPDQPGLPVQPNPNLPQDPTVGTTTTTTTTTTTDGTTVNGTTTGTNSEARVVGGTVMGGSVLDTQGATQKIESTTFVTRDQALRQVERSSTLGAGYIGMIERNTGTLTGEARTRVNDAIRRANAARTELDKSISLARSSNERRWKDARAELLERYRAYDQALADARAAAIEAGAQVDAQAGTTSNSGM